MDMFFWFVIFIAILLDVAVTVQNTRKINFLINTDFQPPKRSVSVSAADVRVSEISAAPPFEPDIAKLWAEIYGHKPQTVLPQDFLEQLKDWQKVLIRDVENKNFGTIKYSLIPKLDLILHNLEFNRKIKPTMSDEDYYKKTAAENRSLWNLKKWETKLQLPWTKKKTTFVRTRSKYLSLRR